MRRKKDQQIWDKLDELNERGRTMKIRKVNYENNGPVVAVESYIGKEWLRLLVRQPGRFETLVDGQFYHFTTSFDPVTLIMTIQAREA